MPELNKKRRALPLDAITSLCIESGLGKDQSGNPIQVLLSRAVPAPSRTVLPKHFEEFPTMFLPALPPLPPPPPPSGGPPLVLRVQLDEELPKPNEDEYYDSDEEDEEDYYNALAERRSWVFALKVVEPESYPFYVPPLVIKIAGERRGKALAQEAGMYQDMHSIQGFVVARCFGYFRSTVDLRTMSIVPWDPKCKFPIDPNDDFRPPHPSASLNVMVLERLGDHIPIGSVPKKELQDELMAMFGQLIKLNIDHQDVIYSNILCAPASPPGLKGKRSSKSKRPFNYRIIDFELSRRINETPRGMKEAVWNWVRMIADDAGRH